MGTGNLNILQTSGFDSFTNLWDVSIVFPSLSPYSASGNEISLRVSDFTPPEVSLKTYHIQYKGQDLERFSAQLEYKSKRELNLTFRLDSGYGLLEALQNWKHLYYNASGDGDIKFGQYSSSTRAGSTGTITVKAYKSSAGTSPYSLSELVSTDTEKDHIGAEWVFSDVALLDVNVQGYSREDSKPQTVKCMFVYGPFTEPYSNDGVLR